MTTVRIHRATVRHQGVEAPDRGRVERALTAVDPVAEDRLDDALAAAGIGADEIVVLPRLEVPLLLDGGAAGARRIRMLWAEGLGQAVRAAVERGDAVRYRSRGAALEDVVRRAGRGDLARAWAWVVLGLWPSHGAAPSGDAPVGLAHALGAEPGLAPAVVRGWCRSLGADAVARQLRPEGWVAVARAVVAAHGGRTGLVDEVRTAVGTEQPLAPAVLRLLALVADDPGAVRRADDGALARAVARSAGPAVGATDATDAIEPGHPDDDLPPARATEHAGLLFLLHLVPSVAPEAPEPGWRWLLHRTGRVLTGATGDDPAVLAFAGTDEPPPGPDGLDDPDVLALAAALQTAALERLGPLRPDEPGADDPFGLLLRRAGVLRADPGWIELELATASLWLPARRAGLDLDPGWLPWLGTVVVFRYRGGEGG